MRLHNPEIPSSVTNLAKAVRHSYDYQAFWK